MDDDVAALEQFEPEPEKKGAGARVAIWLTAVAAVLALAYVGAAWYLQDKVPNNTSVLGVGIGGLSVPAAQERLEEELGGLDSDPLQLALGNRTATIDPSSAGLGVDTEATVASLAGFSLDPRILWAHLVGSGDVDPVSAVDEQSLRDLLEAFVPSSRSSPSRVRSPSPTAPPRSPTPPTASASTSTGPSPRSWRPGSPSPSRWNSPRSPWSP